MEQHIVTVFWILSYFVHSLLRDTNAMAYKLVLSLCRLVLSFYCPKWPCLTFCPDSALAITAGLQLLAIADENDRLVLPTLEK